MLPDRVSNPGPLTYESGALPIALRGPAFISLTKGPRLSKQKGDGMLGCDCTSMPNSLYPHKSLNCLFKRKKTMEFMISITLVQNVMKYVSLLQDHKYNFMFSMEQIRKGWI